MVRPRAQQRCSAFAYAAIRSTATVLSLLKTSEQNQLADFPSLMGKPRFGNLMFEELWVQDRKVRPLKRSRAEIGVLQADFTGLISPSIISFG
jgi:hypothetical protein